MYSLFQIPKVLNTIVALDVIFFNDFENSDYTYPLKCNPFFSNQHFGLHLVESDVILFNDVGNLDYKYTGTTLNLPILKLLSTS